LHPCSECCIEFDIWIHLGTHISNTREAKAFALLSEEGIAKGIRRITAVTTDCAFKAMELAYSLEQEVNDASKIEASLLEKVFFFPFGSLTFRLCGMLSALLTASYYP
jgi:alanyl-tRNA synthetase